MWTREVENPLGVPNSELSEQGRVHAESSSYLVARLLHKCWPVEALATSTTTSATTSSLE